MTMILDYIAGLVLSGLVLIGFPLLIMSFEY